MLHEALPHGVDHITGFVKPEGPTGEVVTDDHFEKPPVTRVEKTEGFAVTRPAAANQIEQILLQEIVQDVWSDFFVKVVPGESCPAAAALRAFLIRSACNKVCDAHREHLAAQKRSRDLECALPAEVQERGPTREQDIDFRDELEHDLQKLSKQVRDAVTMRLDGASLAQVAEALGIDVRTVRNILDRIVQRRALRALDGLRGRDDAEEEPEKL
jgi:RNA polymerase sigma factor (sigma-70 family)